MFLFIKQNCRNRNPLSKQLISFKGTASHCSWESKHTDRPYPESCFSCALWNLTNVRVLWNCHWFILTSLHKTFKDMNRQTETVQTGNGNNHSHNCPLITRPQEVTLLVAGAVPCTDQIDPGESVYSDNTGILLRQVEADHAHMSVYTSACTCLNCCCWSYF